jgi:hypothetical protein
VNGTPTLPVAQLVLTIAGSVGVGPAIYKLITFGRLVPLPFFAVNVTAKALSMFSGVPEMMRA